MKCFPTYASEQGASSSTRAPNRVIRYTVIPIVSVSALVETTSHSNARFTNRLPNDQDAGYVTDEHFPFAELYQGEPGRYALPTNFQTNDAICPAVKTNNDDPESKNVVGRPICLAHLLTLTPTQFPLQFQLNKALQRSQMAPPELLSQPVQACQAFRFSQREWARQYLHNMLTKHQRHHADLTSPENDSEISFQTMRVGSEEWRRIVFTALARNRTPTLPSHPYAGDDTLLWLSSPLIYPRQWFLRNEHIINFHQTGDWGLNQWADSIDRIFVDNFGCASLPCLGKRWMSAVHESLHIHGQDSHPELQDVSRHLLSRVSKADRREQRAQIDKILKEVPLTMGMYIALDVEFIKLITKTTSKGAIQSALAMLMAMRYHPPGECDSFADRIPIFDIQSSDDEVIVTSDGRNDGLKNSLEDGTQDGSPRFQDGLSQSVCEFPFRPTLTCDLRDMIRVARTKKAVVHSAIISGMAMRDAHADILVAAIQMLIIGIGHLPIDAHGQPLSKPVSSSKPHSTISSTIDSELYSESKSSGLNDSAQFEADTLDLMFLTMAMEHILKTVCQCRLSCFRSLFHRSDAFGKSIFEYSLIPIRDAASSQDKRDSRRNQEVESDHPWLAMRFILYAMEWMARHGQCSYKMAEQFCLDAEDRKSIERSWIRVKLLSSLIRPWVPKGRSTLHPVDKVNYFLPLKQVNADLTAMIFGVAGDDDNFDLAIQAFGARGVRQLAIVLASTRTEEVEDYRMCDWSDDLATRRAREKSYSLELVHSLLFHSTFSDFTSGFGSDDQLSDRELWSLVNMMVQCAAVWPEARDLFLNHVKRLGQPSEHNIAYLSFLFSATLTQIAYINDPISSPYYNIHPPEINAVGVQYISDMNDTTYHPPMFEKY